MAAPTFNAALHNIGINGKGYMVAPDSRVQRTDALPATKRAAFGESDKDVFPIDAFLAMTTWEGGVGQGRFVAQDSFLSGFCDGTHQGHLFPARAATTESDGGTTTWYFARRPLGAAPVLYGMTAGFIELIGTATTRARTAGAIGCKPVVTGSQYAYWTQGSAGARTLYQWDGNTANAPTNISSRLDGLASADVAVRYERGLHVLGLGTPTTTPAIIQSASAEGAAVANVSVNFPATVVGNLVVVGILQDTAAPFSASITDVSGFSAGPSLTQGTLRVDTFYRANCPSISEIGGGFSGSPTESRITMVELEGCAPTSVLDVSNSVARAASQTMNSASVTTTETNVMVINFHATAGGTGNTSGYTNSYTELRDDSGTGHEMAVSYLLKATAAATNTACTTTAAAGDIVVITLGFKKSAIPSGADMFGVWRSIDEAATFESIFPDTSTGIGEPRAALAVGGYLYFTTDTGLFRLKLQERAYADQVITELVVITGEHDRWDTPASNDTVAPVGKWMDTYAGLLYYNVGGTVRQFAPSDTGGEGRQLWPPDGWDWLGGEVRALVCGEGGVYFTVQVGSNAILFRYNMRSFQCLAKFVTGSAGDYLHFHQGHLYLKADPAEKLHFEYPSTRPDAAGVELTGFTTGYMVTSKINLDAEFDYKVARRFATQAEFTALADSGTITLEYRLADSGRHPDAFFPDNVGITWTSIGTHTVTDGNTKEFTLATPVEFKSIYLRVTLAPGASGYPILEGLVLNGRPVMRALKRITADLWLATGIMDRAGTKMYASAADVNSAIDELITLRGGAGGPSTRYFNVDYVDDDNSATTYVCTFEGISDQLIQQGHDGATNPQLDTKWAVMMLELQ